tara:strand:- start:4285 stop:4512 length:228 start_codon:yes stop_codon:yes gene_type:complete
MAQTQISPETNAQGRSPRRSLAVDDETFDTLDHICEERGWTKIEALKRLINREKDKIAREKQLEEMDEERAYNRP